MLIAQSAQKTDATCVVSVEKGPGICEEFYTAPSVNTKTKQCTICLPDFCPDNPLFHSGSYLSVFHPQLLFSNSKREEQCLVQLHPINKFSRPLKQKLNACAS